jgi:hypothetical protein
MYLNQLITHIERNLESLKYIHERMLKTHIYDLMDSEDFPHKFIKSLELNSLYIA